MSCGLEHLKKRSPEAEITFCREKRIFANILGSKVAELFKEQLFNILYALWHTQTTKITFKAQFEKLTTESVSRVSIAAINCLKLREENKVSQELVLWDRLRVNEPKDHFTPCKKLGEEQAKALSAAFQKAIDELVKACVATGISMEIEPSL